MEFQMDRHITEYQHAMQQDPQRFSINEGTLAQEISKVYYWMFFGLLLTGITAFLVSTSEQLTNAIYATPLHWVVMLAPLGLVFFLSARIHKITASTAGTLFLVFSILMGLSISYIFTIYTGTSIATTFAVTGITFFLMATYGYTTKTDLTQFGKLAMFALIGIILASIINIFLGSSIFDMIISGIGVLLFTGLIAYDTQKIKEMIIYNYGMEGSTSGRAIVMGALSLYLDFINLFLFLLRFLGDRD
jgi:hypothetical protein